MFSGWQLGRLYEEGSGCLLGDHEVLARAKIWSVIREEQAHDQTIGEFTRGKWRMTYGLLGERGSVEFSCAEL